MTELTSYFILAFSSLFTLVNPIELSPVLSIVDHCDDKERPKIGSNNSCYELNLFHLSNGRQFSSPPWNHRITNYSADNGANSYGYCH